MSGFRSEIGVIPRAAWIIAIAAAIGFAVFLPAVIGPPDQASRPPGLYLIAYCIGLVFGAYVLLAGYVYGDAKRRGMRYVMWTLLALLIPNAIGFILYFILREPLMISCPNCGGLARQKFAFCQYCGTSLAPSCPHCRRAVEPGWSHCPDCGNPLKE